MNGVYERLIGLAERVSKGSTSTQDRDQFVNLRIKEESAKAEYQNAKLTREIAEIAVIEYTEGIFVQDLATVEGELKLAINRARVGLGT